MSDFFHAAFSNVTKGIQELSAQAEHHINALISDSDQPSPQEDTPFSGGRRLVICFDGSWMSPGHSVDADSQGGVKVSAAMTPSNIVKIAYLLGNGGNQHDRDPDLVSQKVYYHSGVASEVEDTKTAALEGDLKTSPFCQVTQKTTFAGKFGNIHHHLLDAYSWLAKEYQEGDDIYAFGFSRGSTIVRSLFSFIRYAGLAKSSNFESHDALMKEVRTAFEWYKHRDLHLQSAKDFHEKHCHHHVSLKFLGVFDTVAALEVPAGYSKIISSCILTDAEKAIGAIEPNLYHDLRIGTSVQHAYHALSIDENREFFPPTLFEPVNAADLHPDATREQVWFRGAHADIGGGFWEHGLTDISLGWMIGKARAAGLQIRNLESWDVYIAPLLLGTSREFYLARKEVKVHDYYARNPKSKEYGVKTPRDLKHFMDEQLFFKSSLHDSVVSVLANESIPDNLKPFF
ncbi:hypothetical protein HDU98_011012 [Podochytrium sp. JEL0797]|nr:hypothetical protein HDU98_011012 [Podochytrium sp. JEL0797]